MQTKFSHLDVIGRPVIALEKSKVVPEHDQYFQVHLHLPKIMNCLKLIFLIQHLTHVEVKMLTNGAYVFFRLLCQHSSLFPLIKI